MPAGDQSGVIWEHALDSFGQNVARAIDVYRKNHEQITETDKLVHTLAQTPRLDGSGAIIDEKAMADYSAQSGMERAHWLGRYLAAHKIQQELYNQVPHRVVINGKEIPGMLQIGGKLIRTGELPSDQQGIVTIGGRKFRITSKGDKIPLSETSGEKGEVKQSQHELAIADPGAKVEYGKLMTAQDIAQLPSSQQLNFKVGQWSNQYPGAEKGDMARVISATLPKPIVIPRKQYEDIVKRRRPSQKHIDLLKKNPTQEMKDYFDQRYGSGAANHVLGITPVSTGASAKDDTMNDTETDTEDDSE
jgi:hypothetical protein